MEFLFVYGTLMKKCKPNEWSVYLQENANYIGEAWMEGLLYQVDYYPGLVKGKGKVYGELFELKRPISTLQTLDEYEGYDVNDQIGSLYKRGKSKVFRSNKEEKLDAWVYFFNQKVTDLLPLLNGRFISH